MPPIGFLILGILFSYGPLSQLDHIGLTCGFHVEPCLCFLLCFQTLVMAVNHRWRVPGLLRGVILIGVESVMMRAKRMAQAVRLTLHTRLFMKRNHCFMKTWLIAFPNPACFE